MKALRSIQQFAAAAETKFKESLFEKKQLQRKKMVTTRYREWKNFSFFFFTISACNASTQTKVHSVYASEKILIFAVKRQRNSTKNSICVFRKTCTMWVFLSLLLLFIALFNCVYFIIRKNELGQFVPAFVMFVITENGEILLMMS